MQPPRRSIRPLAFALILACLSGAVVAGRNGDGEARSKRAGPMELAAIDVFYAEPPFAYRSGDELRVKIRSFWKRDKIERALRQAAWGAGGDLVLVTGSDSQRETPRIVRTPGPGGRVDQSLEIPPETVVLIARLGSRPDDDQDPAVTRFFDAPVDALWNACIEAIESMGLDMDVLDAESRSLVTSTRLVSRVLVECDDDSPATTAVRFVIVVGGFRNVGRVRLQPEFLSADDGSPVSCRSLGGYEQSVFDRVARTIGVE